MTPPCGVWYIYRFVSADPICASISSRMEREREREREREGEGGGGGGGGRGREGERERESGGVVRQRHTYI